MVAVAAPCWRISPPRLSPPRRCSLERRRQAGGVWSEHGCRGGSGVHVLTFCPPSPPTRWRLLRRHRGVCEGLYRGELAAVVFSGCDGVGRRMGIPARGQWKAEGGSALMRRLRSEAVADLKSGDSCGARPRPMCHKADGVAGCGELLLRTAKQFICDGAAPDLASMGFCLCFAGGFRAGGGRGRMQAKIAGTSRDFLAFCSFVEVLSVIVLYTCSSSVFCSVCACPVCTSAI